MGGTYPGQGVPTLAEGGGTYLKLRGGGYVPWIGGGVPTLNRRSGHLPRSGGGGTYLGWGGGGVPNLDGGKGYLP